VATKLNAKSERIFAPVRAGVKENPFPERDLKHYSAKLCAGFAKLLCNYPSASHVFEKRTSLTFSKERRIGSEPFDYRFCEMNVSGGSKKQLRQKAWSESVPAFHC